MYPSAARRCACKLNPAMAPLIRTARTHRLACFMSTPLNATTKTRKHEEERPNRLRGFVVAFDLNVHNVENALQALQRIASWRRPVFMGDVPGEPEVGDDLRHEPIVEFLRVIELAAAGYACSVEVGDPRKMIPNVGGDIALHNLDVVDV